MEVHNNSYEHLYMCVCTDTLSVEIYTCIWIFMHRGMQACMPRERERERERER